jgi:hypothetical protein
MGILRTNTLSGLGTDGPVFEGVTKFDTQGYFVPPSGTTDQRSAGITTVQGTIRFNTDSQKLEFYAQDQWWEMVIDTPALGVAANTDAGARGVWGGGLGPSPGVNSLTIDYVNISSTGNSLNFGNLTGTNRGWISALASSTRGIWSGGSDFPGNNRENTIDYVTISSTGNAIDFGDLVNSYLGGHITSCSNSTRGLVAGGYDYPVAGNHNIIQYMTIASTGNTVDFGDLTEARRGIGACASSTRGLFGGGVNPAGSNVIDFVTISTLGNAQDFGDLTTTTRRDGNGSCSNSIRGLWAGTVPGSSNVIEYIMISTRGNAVRFGDLTIGRGYVGSCASPTRGVFSGGSPSINVIDYVNILTQGNAVDFGDMTNSYYTKGGCSNAHGGL